MYLFYRLLHPEGKARRARIPPILPTFGETVGPSFLAAGHIFYKPLVGNVLAHSLDWAA